MKIRHSTDREQDKIELQMTPMIDIVFQLLVFFVMTFKIVAQEGDFYIKMPLAAPSGVPSDATVPPMRLRLTAGADGILTGIRLNERDFASFEELHRHIIGIVGDDQPDSFRESAEIEIDADYQLRYEYTIQAITAITGYRTPDRNVVKLIENIRFSPPKPPPDGVEG
jgi:biopolymer transport protein ExbD